MCSNPLRCQRLVYIFIPPAEVRFKKSYSSEVCLKEQHARYFKMFDDKPKGSK